MNHDHMCFIVLYFDEYIIINFLISINLLCVLIYLLSRSLKTDNEEAKKQTLDCCTSICVIIFEAFCMLTMLTSRFLIMQYYHIFTLLSGATLEWLFSRKSKLE